MEFTLLWAALAGAAATLLTVRLERDLDPDRDLADLALGAAVVGLVIGRVAAMLLQGTNPLTKPGDLLFVRGGVDTGLASAGALGFVAVKARRDLWRTADLLAPAAMAGLAGWHVGCAFRSACAGTVTGLPWGVTAPGSALMRHPVEIYAAVAFALAALLLYRLLRRGTLPSGVIAGSALAGAGTIRWATEPFRLSIGSGPTAWYVLGLLAGIALVVYRVTAKRGS